jgi:hypothetical protein
MHGQGCLRQLPSPNAIVMSSSTTEENSLASYSVARVLTSDLQTLAGSQGVGMEVNKVCKVMTKLLQGERTKIIFLQSMRVSLFVCM